MSLHSYNDTFKRQNKRLLPATFKKGFISSVNTGTRTANIYLTDNPNTLIRGVPLATHINVATLHPGAQCRVDVFNEQTTNNMVIAYTW